MYLYYITKVASIGAILVLGIVSFLYFSPFFFKKALFYLKLGIGCTSIAVAFWITQPSGTDEISVIALIVLMVLFLKLLYSIPILKALLCAITVGLNFVIFRGIGVSLILIAMKLVPSFTISDLVKDNLTIVMATIGLIGFAYIAKKTYAPIEKVKALLDNYSQQRFLLIFESWLLINLMLVHGGRDIFRQFSWFHKIYIESFLLAFIFVILITKNAVKVSCLIEKEMRGKFLEEQLDRQLEHYQSYQKYTEGFKAFKHDYKNLIIAVKLLLDKKECDRARVMLDEIYDIMTAKILITDAYSNNLILDAVFFDAANRCESKKIKFNAKVFVNKEIFIDDLNLVRIFSNLIDNAVEATSKVADPNNRFLSIIGKPGENNWILIEIKNSYAEKLMLSEDNKFLSTKKDATIHGQGIKIVADIVEEHHGVMEIDIISEKNVFITKLFFASKMKEK